MPTLSEPEMLTCPPLVECVRAEDGAGLAYQVSSVLSLCSLWPGDPECQASLVTLGVHPHLCRGSVQYLPGRQALPCSLWLRGGHGNGGLYPV